MRSVFIPSSPLAFAFTFAFASFVTACSDDSKRPDANSYDGGADAGTGVPDLGGGFPDAVVSVDADEDPDADIDPDADVNPDATTDPPDSGIMRDPNCPQAARWVTSVQGRIIDDNAQPSVGSKAQLCIRTVPAGMLLCLRPEDSEADGSFTIDVPAAARCMDEATMRFVRPLEDTAASYCHLDLTGGSDIVSVASPFRIYATARATIIPPEGDRTMRRTVQFADGLQIDIVPNDYFPGSGVYGDLAASAVQIPSDDACGLAGQAPFDGTYALSPEGDLRNRATVRMPNTAQLPANSSVDVYVLGGLGCTLDNPDMIPEGAWTQIEDGTVSADGMTIEVTPGLPCISWIAYRR